MAVNREDNTILKVSMGNNIKCNFLANISYQRCELFMMHFLLNSLGKQNISLQFLHSSLPLSS